MYIARHLSPMIPSFDLQKTVSFFTDILNFTIVRSDTSYVICAKDNSMVHMLNAGTAIGEMECYLEVDDIDKLWAGMKDKVQGLTYKAPFDREYGMREVHIVVPETKTLMFIGQPKR